MQSLICEVRRMRAIIPLLIALIPCQLPAAVYCGQQFQIDGSYVPYCSNKKSKLPAVIIVHGSDLNPDDYLSYIDDLDVLVIAPHFRESAGNGLYWGSGWRGGDKSVNAPRVSSFEVVDRMVDLFGAKYILGHSAGGQFVVRYAAGTVRGGLRFIAMNPGTYMWHDASRPVAGSCSDYNDYRAGLRNLNDYMSGRAVQPGYPTRDVIYMLGANDTAITSSLSTSCASNRQGANRRERGENFWAHMQALYGSRLTHRLVIVPGVGHSGSAMSKAAREYLPR